MGLTTEAAAQTVTVPATQTVNEPATHSGVSVTFTGDPGTGNGDFAVPEIASGGTASGRDSLGSISCTAGDDFVLNRVDDGVSISEGQSTHTAANAFTVCADTVDEPTETFTLRWVLVSGNLFNGSASHCHSSGNSCDTTFTLIDDDPTVVSLARVGSGAVTEGGKVEFTVTLGRALVAGETIDVPLSIGGTGVTTGDWSLAEKSGMGLNTGVSLRDGGTSTPKVRFTGANAETATLELTATADGMAESGGSETFSIALGSNSDFDAAALGTDVGGGADPHATASMNSFDVTVNDSVKELIWLTKGEYNVTEGGAVRGEVHISNPRGVDTTISLTERGGTATSGTDYNAGPYSVTIPAGKTSAAFWLHTKQDTGLESQEAFTLEIDTTSLPDYEVDTSSGRYGSATVKIEDDEYTLTFDAPSYVVREDAGELAVTLSYSRPTPRDEWVKFLYSDITATIDVDYTPKNAFPEFLFVPAGTEKLTLRVPIHIDDVWENNELFSIKAEPSELPDGHLESSTQVIITAIDPDVEFRASAFTAHEGRDAVVTFRVVDNLSDTLLALRKPVTLHVAAKGTGTATAGTDHAAGPWSLTIPKGASRGVLRIPIHADSASDDGETIELEIKNTGILRDLADASGAKLSGHEHVRVATTAATYSIGPEATVTIKDGAGTGQGTPRVFITAGPAVTEGDQATFTLTATPAPTTDIDVSVHVDDPTGGHVADEDRGLQTATIDAGSKTGTLTVTTQPNGTDRAGVVRAVLMSPRVLFGDKEADYSAGRPSVARVAVADGTADAPPIQAPSTKVANLRMTAASATRASASWDAVPHATGYEVEWSGRDGGGQEADAGLQSVIGTSFDIDHNAQEALTLTVTVTPKYVDGNGATQLLNDLAGTTTLDVGPAGTQGADTQTIAPNACVSTELQSDVEGYAKENYGAAHVARWKKVLKTFAGETGGMTGAEARQMEKTYSANRWHPVAEAIECLEAADQPVAVPEVTISGGNGVTEGDPASFTITADPAPTAPLDVTLTVGQSGDFAAGTIGSRKVTVPTGGSVTVDIATVDDSTDEPDGSVSVTVDPGTGYTVGSANAHTVNVADDDNAPANAYAALITKMYTWRNDSKWGSYKSHTDRWDRALLAFGESVSDTSLTPMTASEAQAFADRGWTRWVEVAAALHEIESGGTVTSDPVPEVTISGGAGVTEGDPASFTVIANPAPTAPLAVTLTVGQSGDVAAAGATGSREVVVPTGGSVTLDIATVDDAVDEPDGSVSVTVDVGNGYTVGSANAHTVNVADDDTAPTTVPELSLSTGSNVDEGDDAEFTITANPAPQADLTVQFTVTQSGDYLSVPPSSRTVTLTAGATGTTVSLSTVEDSTAEADGSVSMTIDAGTDYTVAPGQASGSVTVRDNDDPPAVPVVSIAAGAGVTEGDPASFTVTANPAPAASLTITLTVGQSGDYAATGQTGSREVVVPTGGSVTVEVATDDDSADEPDGSITATLAAGSGYTVAASPDDTASVAVTDNDEAAGVPSLSVVDGEANESKGRVPVVIRLNPPSKNPVSVWVTLRESNPVSAQEGVDYKTWGRFGFRTTFRPGETRRQFAVAVINDSHDEGKETFEVVLSDPSGGAAISDGVGVMTIVNSDPMPAAWLARFGRTVAEQALDGISGRMAASRTAGTRGSLAGQTLSFGNGGETDREDVLDRFGHNGFHVDPRNPDDGESRNLSGNDLLLGSSFTSTGEQDGSGGSLAFWGRGAQSNFDGREGAFSLDGETTTTMLGADYARDNWLVGLALTQSSGKGDYRGNGTGGPDCTNTDDRPLCPGAVREGYGKVKASLTAAIPYAAIEASEGLKLWGALGYGSGEVTLKPEPDENADAESYKSDIDWTMMAVGGRSELLPLPKEGSGPAVTLTGDALWARTESEKTKNLAASDSDVTRLRLGLEGSWRIATEGDGSITPKLELGVRQDGGDAETGSGMELGAGIAWRDPGLGLSLDLSGRTLITHTDEDLENEGYSVSFHYDPRPASARGLALSLSQEIGGPAAGGLDALFAPEPLGERPDSDDDSRLKLEAAYGFPAFSGRYISSPGVSFGRASGSRDYGLGWHFTPVKNASRVSFGVKATRRESEGASSKNAVGVEASLHW